MSTLCNSSSFCLFLEFRPSPLVSGSGRRFLWKGKKPRLQGICWNKPFCTWNVKLFIFHSKHMRTLQGIEMQLPWKFDTAEGVEQNLFVCYPLYSTSWIWSAKRYEEKTAIMFNLKLRINAPAVSQWGVKARPDEAMLTADMPEAQYDSCMMLIWECVTRKMSAPRWKKMQKVELTKSRDWQELQYFCPKIAYSAYSLSCALWIVRPWMFIPSWLETATWKRRIWPDNCSKASLVSRVTTSISIALQRGNKQKLCTVCLLCRMLCRLCTVLGTALQSNASVPWPMAKSARRFL